MLRIGKRMLSWNSTKFRMAGAASEKITSIDLGEKIARELVYGNRRDGTPHGITAGEWQPDAMKIKILADEWFGVDAVRTGYLGLMTLNKSVGLADVEFDAQLQFFEEVVGGAGGPTGPGTVTIYFPLLVINNPHLAIARGVTGSEVDLEIGVIEPPQANGAQLASLIRSFSGASFGPGF